jgi:myo-inositol-1(or 4)-monophosphatase
MTEMEKALEFAKEVAYAAGEIMRQYFNRGAERSRYKSDDTIVTVADEGINQMVIERVREVYPEHGVFGEESSENADREYVWLCDPLDGTLMYTRGIPVAVFSLALVVDGEPVVGVVYAPFTDRLYTAVKDGGAFVNGERIQVNNYSLADKEAGVGYSHAPTMPYDVREVMCGLNKTVNVGSVGSLAHNAMLVADGGFAAAVACGNRPYDIAAAKVIVEEAGGRVTDLWGKEQRYDREIAGAVASNGVVHEELIGILRNDVK